MEMQLQFELITKSIKAVVLLLGFIILSSKIKHNFAKKFFWYLLVSIILDIVSIYIEKSDNDVKICIHFIIIFIYPTIFYGKDLKFEAFLIIVLFLALLPE